MAYRGMQGVRMVLGRVVSCTPSPKVYRKGELTLSRICNAIYK